MRVLIGCEESQIVTMAFREYGHEAFSCDIKPCSGGHPAFHIQKSVKLIWDQGWDLDIFFPTCTYNCKDQLWRCLKEPARMILQDQSVQFIRKIWNCPIPRIAIENPDGCLTKRFQMWDKRTSFNKFGDPYLKDICLWLKTLPPLVEGPIVPDTKSVSNHVNGRMDQETKSRIKSRFFPGIANAMAIQWGGLPSFIY